MWGGGGDKVAQIRVSETLVLVTLSVLCCAVMKRALDGVLCRELCPLSGGDSHVRLVSILV